VPYFTRSSATAEIARVGGRYDVQGHSRPLMLVPIDNPNDFILVNNTNLHPISHRLSVTAQLL